MKKWTEVSSVDSICRTEDRIREIYAGIIHEFPYCWLYLEYYIRISNITPWLMKRQCGRAADKLLLANTLKSRIKQSLFRFYLLRKEVVVELPKNQSFSKALVNDLRGRGWRAVAASKIFKRRIGVRDAFVHTVLHNNDFKRIQNVLRNANLLNPDSCSELFARLDPVFRSNYGRSVDVLGKSPLKLIVSNFDYGLPWGVLSKACRDVGIPFLTINHGVAGGGFPTGVLSGYSSSVLVGDRRSYLENAEIFSRLSRPQKSLYFGNLYGFTSGKGDAVSAKQVLSKSKRFLLLVSPRLHLDSATSEIYERNLREACDILSQVGICVRLRPHPKARAEDLTQMIAMDYSFEVGEGALDDDLNWAELVIGGESTVFYEAAQVGVPAIQVKELELGFMDWSVNCTLSELEGTLQSEHQVAAECNEEFNYGELLKEVDSLLRAAV